MLNQSVAHEKRVGGIRTMKKVTLYHNPG